MLGLMVATVACLKRGFASSSCGASGSPCVLPAPNGATLLQQRAQDWRAAQPQSKMPTSLEDNSMYDQSDLLPLYEQLVEEDVQCQSLRRSLLQYAEEEVERNLAEIRSNLQSRIDTLDVLWPDSGYRNVANGGSFEVLAILEKKNILRIGNIMGTGRGATSAILSIAGNPSGCDTLLKYYMAFAKYAASEMQVGDTMQPRIWKEIYERVVQDNDTFGRVKARAWAVSKCGAKTAVFHNYATREQVVQAFFASGDNALSTYLWGTYIDGMAARIDAPCVQGGHVDYFPNRRNVSLMVYRTDHIEPTQNLDLNSIEKLFKRGVDETIFFLKHPLSSGVNLKAVVPLRGTEWTWDEYERLELSGCASYFDIEGVTVVNTCEGEVAAGTPEPCTTTDAEYCGIDLLVDCSKPSVYNDCFCFCEGRP